MAEGARVAAGLGADIIDINMGCPAREVTGKLSGSRPDARPRSRRVSLIEAVVGAVRSARHAQDAAGLGRRQPQRARAGAPRRGRRRAAHHRARAHPLPVLQGRAPTGPRAPREGGRAHSRRRQRRHRRSRRRAGRACSLRRRRRDGRARRLWRAVDAGAHRAVPRRRAAIPARPHSPSKARSPLAHVEAMLDAPRRGPWACATPASISAGTWQRAAQPADTGQGVAPPPVHVRTARAEVLAGLRVLLSTPGAGAGRMSAERCTRAVTAASARRHIEHDLLLGGPAASHPGARRRRPRALRQRRRRDPSSR